MFIFACALSFVSSMMSFNSCTMGWHWSYFGGSSILSYVLFLCFAKAVMTRPSATRLVCGFSTVRSFSVCTKSLSRASTCVSMAGCGFTTAMMWTLYVVSYCFPRSVCPGYSKLCLGIGASAYSAGLVSSFASMVCVWLSVVS